MTDRQRSNPQHADAIPHSDCASWYHDYMRRCPDCDPGVDHCHGTLVVHSDRTAECTDTACELPDTLRHAFVIDCIAVSGGCCVTEEATDIAVAS
jgi:hypothetical protein